MSNHDCPTCGQGCDCKAGAANKMDCECEHEGECPTCEDVFEDEKGDE